MGRRNGSRGDEIKRAFALPPGAVRRDYKLLMIGVREVSIEGCRGILEYESTVIRLSLGQCQLKVTGRDLVIRLLDGSCVELEGFVTGLEFSA